MVCRGTHQRASSKCSPRFCTTTWSNVSDSTLRLLDILTMVKQGIKGDELFHMESTDRVQWFTKGKIGLTKVQCGVQTMRAYNFQDDMKASTHCAVQDVDTRLTVNLWNHWFAHRSGREFDELHNNWLQLSELVHSRHQADKSRRAHHFGTLLPMHAGTGRARTPPCACGSGPGNRVSCIWQSCAIYSAIRPRPVHMAWDRES